MKGKSLLTVVLLVAGFLAAGFPSFAQDIITKKDGTDIKAKVLEVNESEVKYRRYDYLDGPIFTMLKSEILIVRYENGTNDVFNGKVKYVPVVKSEPEPTVEDVEDRDREDVKKETKGSCTWISGNTRPIKEELKAAGFRWSKKNGAWYRREAA